MLRAIFTYLVTLAMALSVTAFHANAQGCTLEGVTLSCGNGNDSSKLDAMASEETANLFSNPLENLDKFQKPSDIEAFRRSVEKNWRAANRTERRQRRKMLRRQISASEFEAWSKNYDAARENYAAALNFYRTLVWHGKNGKPAPKG